MQPAKMNALLVFQRRYRDSAQQSKPTVPNANEGSPRRADDFQVPFEMQSKCSE